MHPLAGQPAPRDVLVDVPRLVTAFFTLHPDPADPARRVRFGTSGHRGSSLEGTFNADHVVAMTAAICAWRAEHGVDGPLYLGADTHALSEPARAVALEVLAAHGVEVRLDAVPVPTPLVSHAILAHGRRGGGGAADGIVVTPSHNPPEHGGFKYNPPHGGPAGAEVTAAIEARANAILAEGVDRVPRWTFARAMAAPTTRRHDFAAAYADDLGAVLDMEAIRAAGLRIGADPLGGSGIAALRAVAERWGLDLRIVDDRVDPTFSFMTLDRDGRIRMDCSSPWAMARLVGLKDDFDVAFGNDPDFDRHGVVTPAGGLLDPNRYLALAVDHLFRRRAWPARAAVGKTLVSSALIDRVAAGLGRRLVEVPVGFKWFVPGLASGELGFGGEESAGASFLRRDGTAWTTDKDGIVMGLLAAAIAAVTGADPAERLAALLAEHGEPAYARVDLPAGAEARAALRRATPADLGVDRLAGEPVRAVLDRAPGNGAPIGGLKVVAEGGWFAVRPSGTEDVIKLYAESLRGPDHLARVQADARAALDRLLGA